RLVEFNYVEGGEIAVTPVTVILFCLELQQKRGPKTGDVPSYLFLFAPERVDDEAGNPVQCPLGLLLIGEHVERHVPEKLKRRLPHEIGVLDLLRVDIR